MSLFPWVFWCFLFPFYCGPQDFKLLVNSAHCFLYSPLFLHFSLHCFPHQFTSRSSLKTAFLSIFFCLQHGTEASSSHYSKHYHSCPSIITCIFYGHPSTSSDLVARTDWPFTLVLASISLFCFFQRTRLLLSFAICPCTQSFCFSLSQGSGKFITKDLSQKVSSITKVVIKNRCKVYFLAFVVARSIPLKLFSAIFVND